MVMFSGVPVKWIELDLSFIRPYKFGVPMPRILKAPVFAKAEPPYLIAFCYNFC